MDQNGKMHEKISIHEALASLDYDSKEKLMKEYEEHKKNILDNFNGHRRYQFIDREYPMRRLYWSEHGFYADAEYVKFNG